MFIENPGNPKMAISHMLGPISMGWSESGSKSSNRTTRGGGHSLVFNCIFKLTIY